jgi:hypothetical protein
MTKKRDTPFAQMGQTLRKARERRKESIVETAGAVEIDAHVLIEMEDGLLRPSEDILLLLISHLALPDREADELWDLAGYDDSLEKGVPHDAPAETTRPAAMVMADDVRIVYTDTVHVVVNNFGVVMNFLQMGGPTGQPLMVSRVGMSKEHARSVLEVLKKTLDQAEQPAKPRLLQSPTENSIDHNPKAENT